MRGSVRPILCSLAVALWSGLAWPVASSGQVVRGELLQTEEGPGLGGAMMTLVDRNGRQMAQVLTRDSGAFDLTAPGPGEYQLRADRIGHASTFSGYFDVAESDTLTFRMVALVEAVSLGSIDVEGDRRCRVRPEEGLAVTRVWTEAQKALSAAAWTQDRGIYQYEMMGLQRLLDRDGRKVVSEDRSYQRGYRKAPYIALPAEQLIEEGFADLDRTESVYYAPDAGVLLSDEFLDTHCFQLRQGEDEADGLIGLSFEPVRGRPVPDIAGTLWLDPSTAQLRWLDFQYRNLPIPPEIMSSLIGGKVEFEALPNGTWIVNSWRIQMPRATTTTNPLTHSLRTVLEGFAVQGGEVLRVHGNEGTVLEADRGGRIAGIVFDSLRTGGLEGANVFVEGTNVGTVTGPDGRFELTHLEPGRYSIVYSHPYLEEFSYRVEPFDVDIDEGATSAAQVNFSAPTRGRMIQSLCRGVEAPSEDPLVVGGSVHRTNGILLGRVTDETGLPLAGATVRVVWREYDIQSFNETSTVDNRLREGRLGMAVTTNTSGHYLACWVPPDILLEVTVVEAPEEGLDPGRIGPEYNMSEILAAQAQTVRVSSESLYEKLDLRVERN